MPSQDMIKLLEGEGFKIARQKGSHAIMIDEKGRRIVVPVHRGKNLKPSLVRAIVKEAGLKREDFFRLLESM